MGIFRVEFGHLLDLILSVLLVEFVVIWVIFSISYEKIVILLLIGVS